MPNLNLLIIYTNFIYRMTVILTALAQTIIIVCYNFRYNFMFGTVVPINKIGFSEPTEDGKKFITCYSKSQDFLIYF